jgi:hypothetical protein
MGRFRRIVLLVAAVAADAEEEVVAKDRLAGTKACYGDCMVCVWVCVWVSLLWEGERRVGGKEEFVSECIRSKR